MTARIALLAIGMVLITGACTGASPSASQSPFAGSPPPSSEWTASASPAPTFETARPTSSVGTTTPSPEPDPTLDPGPTPTELDGETGNDAVSVIVSAGTEIRCYLEFGGCDVQPTAIVDTPGWPVHLDGWCTEGVGDLEAGLYVLCFDPEDRMWIHHLDRLGRVVAGWPIRFTTLSGGPSWNDVSIGCGRWEANLSVDNDRNLYLLVAESDAARVHAFRPDGTRLSGWPRTVPGDRPGPDGSGGGGCRGYRWSPDGQHILAWGYIDVAQDIELIARRTEFTIWDRDGNVQAGWPRGSTGAATGPVWVDGDIVYVSAGARVWRHAPDGEVRPGWGFQLDVMAPPVAGSGVGLVAFVQPTFEDGDRVVVLGSNGAVVSEDFAPLGGSVETSCLFGDTPCVGLILPAFAPDGRLYVALMPQGIHDVSGDGLGTGSIVALAPDGSIVDGWPVRLPARHRATHLAVDIDGGLVVDVVACGEDGCVDGDFRRGILTYSMDGELVP
jgi:hypothetical protein